MKILGLEVCTDFSRQNDSPFFRWKVVSRIALSVILVSFLGACSHFQNASNHLQSLAKEATSENEQNEKNNPGNTKSSLNVVLRAVPRHVLVVPMTNFVWLWDKPGGLTGRAVRIQKVPSGTPAKVVEFEPEKFSPALWAKMSLKNHARQPVRWIKVTTLVGEGWVRAEFVEVH